MSIDDLREVLVEFLSPTVDSILDFISESFFTVLEWLSGFLILDFFPEVAAYGSSFFDTIGTSISSSFSNGNFINIMIGALIAFPLFKIVINIIRG